MLPSVDPDFVRRSSRLLKPLVRYHRFRLEGAGNLPVSGPCLMAVHHSLATYDGFLLSAELWRQTGRLPWGLGDDRVFQIPGLGQLAWRVGLMPASPEAGERVLRAGQVLGVAPGGMWESLRPREERRRSRWQERRGFVRLALRCGAPIVVAAVPAADQIYTVYQSPITDRVYRRYHWPLPLARGLGPTLLPRPVALTGYIAPPLHPPPHEEAVEEEQVEELHRAACERMAELLERP
jgi:1-acyl-sn-glycerol-3-phosphate acyltransferase